MFSSIMDIFYQSPWLGSLLTRLTKRGTSLPKYSMESPLPSPALLNSDLLCIFFSPYFYYVSLLLKQHFYLLVMGQKCTLVLFKFKEILEVTGKDGGEVNNKDNREDQVSCFEEFHI